MNKFSVAYRAATQDKLSLSQTLAYIPCIDLEATCTDDPVEKATYTNEIIEVGWALLRTSDGAVVERQQFYVRPTSTTVNAFCTTLTGIEPETVASAPSFALAMNQLRLFVQQHPLGPFPLWGSFGEYDRAQFERQCSREEQTNPMGDLLHLNVKAAAQMEQGSKRGLGLARALDRYGLQFEGRHHCGMDDAVNVARVLHTVLTRTRAKSA